MFVIKRDGRKQDINFNKILKRIKKFCYDLNDDFIDPALISQKVIDGLYIGIKTTELDNLASEICASMTTTHYQYSTLAARIAISNLHKETKETFSEVLTDLFNHSIVSSNVKNICDKYSEILDSSIQHRRDFKFSYFGFKTLEKSYLLRIDDQIVERPQYMFMRVAIEIHKEDVDNVLETYRLMSKHYFTHATPTLFNSGTIKPQLSSCFLMPICKDSIEGIFTTLERCANISKHSGGIGISISNVRSKGGQSNGLIPMLRIFNSTVRYVGNKRPGAITIYLEPWHADIFDFLLLKKNVGSEEERARDLFYALWIPDLFMERVRENKIWSLMCPKQSPNLFKCWGNEFNFLYECYEERKLYKRQIPARMLWRAIIESQIETGTPFMLYKDACNRKSNHRHLGTIRGSNLCTEIIEYSSCNEIAVCNLASIALNQFVTTETFNFIKLKYVTKQITINLNKIIDTNYYPNKESEVSNFTHRPIGIGVQGLADTFLLMKYAFDSDEARDLNKRIFETLYYSALEASCELAEIEGTYLSYRNSPAYLGLLQFDMWDNNNTTDLWNWQLLREKIKEHGLRNSLLIAIMPTASTAQIFGNNESIEPFTNNIYVRRVLSGEYQVVNHHLLKYLIDNGLWNEKLKNKIIKNQGSIQQIDTIPSNIKQLYRTVWEIPQKSLIDMAVDRAPFIDQSQSLNIFLAKPNYSNMSSMHFHGWKKGLKTGMYYLRTKPAVNPIQFTCEICTS